MQSEAGSLLHSFMLNVFCPASEPLICRFRSHTLSALAKHRRPRREGSYHVTVDVA
jgi:hypothetical protein